MNYPPLEEDGNEMMKILKGADESVPDLINRDNQEEEIWLDDEEKGAQFRSKHFSTDGHTANGLSGLFN